MSDRPRLLPQSDDELPPPVLVAERPAYDFNAEMIRAAYQQSVVTVPETVTSTALVVVPEIATRTEEVVEAPVEETDPRLLQGEVDTYVPEVEEQRLLYHWLRFGPEWRAQIVMEAETPPAEEVIVNPLNRLPRRIDDGDDGVRRTLRPKE